MAIAVTQVSTVSTSVDATSFATSSYTPTAGALEVLWVAATRASSADPGTPTITGNSLTWTSIVTIANLNPSSGMRMNCFAAPATGASTGGVTIDYGAVTVSNCIAFVEEITGADISTVDTSPGNGKSIVQAPTGTGANTSATSGTVTLAAGANSANRGFSFFIHFAAEGTTAGTNWTELSDSNQSPPGLAAEVQWSNTAFDTSGAASWSTSQKWCALAIEVAIATSGFSYHGPILTGVG